jgi:hypothetical protein
MQRSNSNRLAPRQVPADIALANFRPSPAELRIVVRQLRAMARREYPERSDAEIDAAIYSGVLEALGDPAWEGVQ